jgi:hypothetical protein
MQQCIVGMVAKFEHIGTEDAKNQADGNPLSLDSRVTLHALARASRSLYKPALNGWWKHLHSIEPLLKLLPGGALADIDLFDSLLPSPSRLSQLNLGNSPCSNAESMSTFLSRMFPHMQEILVWTHSLLDVDEIPDAEEHKLKWVIVEQCLRETLFKVTR